MCELCPPNQTQAARPASLSRVRVGLVCPYSYTYPGGVLTHVEELAGELRERGHDVRVLAPVDPDDRLTRVLHRGAAPTPRPLPDPEQFVPLGRTIGFESNDPVSNLSQAATTV